MPVANVVGQADNLLIDGQHPFWNGFQASGPPVGRIPSSVQRASNILLLDIHRHRRLLRARSAMNSRRPIPEARRQQVGVGCSSAPEWPMVLPLTALLYTDLRRCESGRKAAA